MNDLLHTLSQTPLPTILVVAGIMFWVLAIAGSVAGKINVEPGKQWTAGLVGTAFIALGLLILVLGPGPANQSDQTATTKAQTPEPRPTKSVGSASVDKTTPPATTTRPSPGVNCTGTGTPDEVAICRNAELTDLDWKLYGVYQSLMKQLDKTRQAKLASEESAWVRQRGECKSDESCITTAYQSRIDQLQSMQ